MGCAVGHATCASQHPSLKETWRHPSWPANGRQGFPPDTATWPAPSRLLRGSHARQSPPAAGTGFGEQRLLSPLPAGALHTPRLAGPGTLQRALPRHAAPPRHSRADGLTWMGRSSGRRARQLRLHRLSRHRCARARLPMPRCRRRARSRLCQAAGWGQGGIPVGCPFARSPGLGNSQHPRAAGAAESEPSGGGKRPGGTTAHPGITTWPSCREEHKDKIGAATWLQWIKSIRVKESGASRSATQDVQLVAACSPT